MIPDPTSISIPTSVSGLADALGAPAELLERQFPSVGRFVLLEDIGSGRHGAIIKATDSQARNQIVALKEFVLRFDGDKSGPNNAVNQSDGHYLPYDAIREVTVLSSLAQDMHAQRCDNVIKSYGVFTGMRPTQEMFLAMEYCSVTLSDLIDVYAGTGLYMDMGMVKYLFYQLITGLAYIHARKIIHRDLTPGNVLINQDGTLKLADFGEARLFVDSGDAVEAGSLEMTRRRTTIWWRAPEVCLGSQNYDSAIDMWAAGCVLGEILLTEPVLQGDTDIQMLDLMAKLLGVPDNTNDRFWSQDEQNVDLGTCIFEKASAYKGKTGSLRAKFKRYGRDEVVEVLLDLLKWDPGMRATSEQILRDLHLNGETTAGVSSSGSWWRRQPSAIMRNEFARNKFFQKLVNETKQKRFA